jgi:PAS domain S-box-containing protein
MGESRSVLIVLDDPRLSPHATGDAPVWLWGADARRILWSNPVAAAIFNAESPAAFSERTVDPNGTATQQIARLAGTLPQGGAPRLERLRGFGGRLGGPLTCACSRIALTDGTPAILVIAAEAAGPRLSLAEQAKRLLAGCDGMVALFSPDGSLLHATSSAQTALAGVTSLAALDAEPLAATALAAGYAEGESKTATVVLKRIGSGASTALLATFAARPAKTPPAKTTSAGTTLAETTAPRPAEPPRLRTPTAGRKQLLRFVWQLDAHRRFTLDSDEFLALIGERTASVLGRPWDEIAIALDLDPEGQIARAFASHETWSGITVAFPVDGADTRLAVEMSGLPVFDRDRNFRGYRGFGICRDMARIDALIEARRAETAAAAEPPVCRDEKAGPEPSRLNVVPFPSPASAEPSPALTPVERKAFSELASRLTARLRNRDKADDIPAGSPFDAGATEIANDRAPRPATPLASTGDQRSILDRLPIGVLVYRLDRMIYANRTFMEWTGYEHLHGLEKAGGLDALFAGPGGDKTLNADNGAKALTVMTSRGDALAVAARLFTSPWDGESALVLMLTEAGGDDRQQTFKAALRRAKAEADELRAILDIAADGVVVLDSEARIVSLNRGAEELFGYNNYELVGEPFATLLAPESRRAALEDLARTRSHRDNGDMLPEGREVAGRRRDGGQIPLFMTIGRIAKTGEIGSGESHQYLIFRDITPWKKTETELLKAKAQAEKASAAKSDFLAKVSHEIRTPLNAIIGFSDVMMNERFGPVGNDRYRQYLKDIHASGGHLVSLLNDLLDLSKIEAGKLDLAFASVDLNGLTQETVALMQPQASRGRIIIRTSLAHDLPTVTADPRSVRQIVFNLLSNSIKFTGAGGQVIVSTAVSDDGNVVLRVRDTGVGMSERDLAVALEPFRQLATSARWGSGGTGLGLPLTKALAEANRARFRIRSAVDDGTLVEIAFSATRLAAE